MATITASAAGGKWSEAAAWEGGVEPKEGDDVILATGSGSITVAAESKCRSIDATNYKKTLELTAILKIGTSTSQAEGICLKLGTGMTFTQGGAGNEGTRIELVSTSATTQKITTAGKKIHYIVFNGAGCTWQLQDEFTLQFTVGTIGRFQMKAGTVETNNQTMVLGPTSGQDIRLVLEGATFKCGSSIIKINGAGEAMRFTAAGTLEAGTSTFEVGNTEENSAKSIVMNGTHTYNKFVVAVDNVQFTIGQVAVTIKKLELLTAGKSAHGTLVSQSASNSITITESLTTNATPTERIKLLGGSFALVGSASGWRLIATAAVTIELANVEISCCHVEGGATPVIRGVGGLDKGGNTGIFFDEDFLRVHHTAGAVSDLGSRF